MWYNSTGLLVGLYIIYGTSMAVLLSSLVKSVIDQTVTIGLVAFTIAFSILIFPTLIVQQDVTKARAFAKFSKRDDYE